MFIRGKYGVDYDEAEKQVNEFLSVPEPKISWKK
jgi:hypothetical protein